MGESSARFPVPSKIMHDEHRFQYRDEHDNIIAECDTAEQADLALRTLITDGHPVLRRWIDGRPALGTYGDYTRDG